MARCANRARSVVPIHNDRRAESAIHHVPGVADAGAPALAVIVQGSIVARRKEAPMVFWILIWILGVQGLIIILLLLLGLIDV